MTVAAQLNGLLPLTGLNGAKTETNGTTNGTTKIATNGEAKSVNGTAKPTKSDYVIPSEDFGTPRKIRLVMVGAGASGLNMARHLELHTENVDYVMYEKNPEVGGTWFENRYPGCACDIPSHNYQFTWETNPDWSTFYSKAPEILEYFKGVAEKYELLKYVKLNHQITRAEWNEDTCKWVVTVQDLLTGETFEDVADIFINGGGILNNWKWPNIPGLHSFKGPLVHSANWPETLDYEGKTVAVLGCGSSGVQIIPTIQPDVKKLITFIRSPTWITAGYAQDKAGPGGANFHFSEDQKKNFRENKEVYATYIKEIEQELNQRFKFILKDSKEQAEARQYATNEMQTKLGHDPRLIKAMIPDFAVGCRRPTPGNGYLEALTQDNVRVITDGIERIAEDGIVLTTGELVKIDIFICATGFDVSFSPRYPVIGSKGIALADQWKTKPEAYMSLAVENFPNYFMFLGPNSPAGHGSILPIIEHATKYMINVIKKIQTKGIKTMSPSHEAVRDFNEHVTQYMDRTAWTSPCRSWFKNGTIDGPVTATHPGSRIHWFHMLDEPNFEDFNLTYTSSNRFSYLGSGFSTREAPGLDSAYYLDDPQEGYKKY